MNVQMNDAASTTVSTVLSIASVATAFVFLMFFMTSCNIEEKQLHNKVQLEQEQTERKRIDLLQACIEKGNTVENCHFYLNRSK